MPYKAGLVTYPTTIAGIKRDTELVRAFNEFLRGNKEYDAYFKYVTADARPAVRYQMFFAKNASHKIQMSPKMQQIADLAFGIEEWDNPDYKKVIDFMEQHCSKLLEGKAVPAFFKSKIFVDHHCARLTGYKDPNKAATEAAKKLNLKDKKHVSVVKQIFLEALFGREAKIARLNKELEETRAKGSKGKGKRDVFAEMKAGRMIHA
ncbi:hypothetical protein [Salipiger bermudensis]|uniref:Uncharacterized protein n=1 Tax=Salipiger bermudensis (strain DSM 26914 / JCM 13377 / KCTC 12554 / HTCC2601) TaxID=314265 RepID=Q0FQF1_SALBH|nr:hypothetical protein [Salipiger bermudensis]EAU46500.1 hypothetical protein R2601_15752 [Salipiger bermudensis HTCC2601]MBN9677258.1 hypothetical protein [Salipiger bermudensis]MCA1285774.1 hypothetical protein [Salipiger bermudensis]